MRLNLIAGIVSVAVLIGASAHAHTLDGVYGGQADGVDDNDAILHQVTRWTFSSGKLVAFREIISLPGTAGSGPGYQTVNFEACQFDASGDLQYSLESLSNTVGTDLLVASGFACPFGSANNRPENVVIIPEDGGKEFSYLEYTVPSTLTTNVPAHFSGHAIAQAKLP
jgi:hypothetical protein